MKTSAVLWVGLLVCLGPRVAAAEWLEASSAHFVVYANDSESNLRTFSQQLERFHAAMAFLTATRAQDPSPSNRVNIYVVGSQSQVRRLYGDVRTDVVGFYQPRAGGSIAIVSNIKVSTNELDFSMIALLHEYAHHFMISSGGFPMPRWYSEGAAEFFSSASFAADGSVGIGRAANHRAGELAFARDVKVAKLLETGTSGYQPQRGDAYYGKSWLLFHYLTFNEQRKGQLTRYLQLLEQGKSSGDAGLEAFGDLERLERELDNYLRQRQITTLHLTPALLQTATREVGIRRLSEAEAAMMPVRIRSRRGVTLEQARALLPEARKVATRFPQDPAVLSALAEAEHDAGNDRESIAAADAALARDPSQINAYVQKGFSLFRLAEDDPDRTAAYARARTPFVALNRLENDHPLPLVYYYLSFTKAGNEPSQVALNALSRAVELAPFDPELRMMLATRQIKSGQLASARVNLGPLAYDPHGGGLATAAQRLLARMDSDPDWNGQDVDELLNDSVQDDQPATPR